MVKKLVFIIALVVAISWAVPEPTVEGQIGYQVTATTVGQAAYPLLAPNGTAGAPSFGWTNDTDTGFYLVAAGNMGLAVGGALVMDWEDTNAAGAGSDLVTISSTTGIMDGSDTVRGLFVDFTNADHEGSTNFLYGLDIDGITGDAEATEIGIRIGDGWDEEIVFATTSNAIIEVGNNGQIDLRDPGSTTRFRLDDSPALTGEGFFEFDVTFVTVMNGSDTQYGAKVDITNGDHTGVTNVLYGLGIDNITGDAQARETGINISTGWDVGISSTNHIFQRENFKQGFRKQLASDFSSATDGDGDVNIVLGTNGVNFEYREELAKGTSSFILNNAGAVDISADNTTNDEGVEFMLGSSQTTTSGYLVAQTDQLCFSVNAKVTLIAGTDQFVIGWRANEAYDAANVYTNYSDYNVVGINNVDGSVFGLSDSTTGGAETDDSGTNWGDGETKTLKACIDGAGLPHGYLDGTLITETNRTTAMDAGINMVPFVSYLQAGGATDAAILINWWEITAN